MGKKTILTRIMSLFLAFAAVFTTLFSFGTTETFAASQTMRGLSASEIVADMGAGWNMGNSLESENNETYWGNPAITREMVNAIAGRGFTTIRIPVRRDDNYSDSSNYTISSAYLDRVETVVNYGLDAGLYVIINVHHNDLQTMVSTDYSTQQRVKNELAAIWTQVGNRFKNYGDKLVFEVNNEPRCGDDWGGNTEYYNCVNEYNETARAAIRATGGNNTERLVMLPTYCASSDSPKLYGWKNLSDDDMVAVSIHAYKPWDFAYEGNGHSNWTDDDYSSLKGTFEELNSVFVSKGIPVVIGEFGATDKNNYSDRTKYAEIYATFAKQYGMACICWDNHSTGYGGSFDASCIAPGGYFYVEYSGTEKELELILQSWSGGVTWAKVEAYEYGYANGNHYAKFSYDSRASAFGSNFAGQLDQIHVGAKNGEITVYSVCYCRP